KVLVRGIHAWQQRRNLPVRDAWSRAAWMTLLSHGARPVLKFGSSGPAVRRLQRTLNAADPTNKLRVSGVFHRPPDQALRKYQRKVKVGRTGVANNATWPKLRAGRR